MNKDTSYLTGHFNKSHIEHKYSKNINILANPYASTLLAKLCESKTILPEVNSLVKKLYQILMMDMINIHLPKSEQEIKTRMLEFTEKGKFNANLIEQQTKLVSVDLARAGTWPSHACFEMACEFLNPENIRQDHIYINRKTNDQGEVIGEDFYGSKIGGDQENAYVIFPDPMGATGGSMSRCISHYKDTVKGKAKKYIALHLIITPEYIKRLNSDHPDVEIFALRLDRGNSSPEILSTIPGATPELESGLTEIQYIVPGAGGMGEVLNNSYV